MITFKLNEIPEGKSSRKVNISTEELELSTLDVKNVMLHIDFIKTERSLQLSFDVEAEASLVCDRSLDKFDQVIAGEYNIIFDTKIEEEDEGEKDAARLLDVAKDEIDISKEVRDTILLSVPAKKLHPRFYDEEGNPSEFSERYPDKDYEDPRWDALKKLQDKNNKD
ncbi:MAG: DUF177 domain-containing protein [Balneolales bacterium]